MLFPSRSALLPALVLLCLSVQPVYSLPAVDVKPPPLSEKDFGSQIGIDFSKTPEYRKETEKAIDDAYGACKQFLKDKQAGRARGIPAVVSDLDETLIDNRPHFVANPKFSWPAFEAWIKKAEAPLLPKTAEFLSWARKNGFAIFFVTGRREGLRADTIANLIKRQVAYDGLLMRKEGDKGGAESVKVPLRQEVEKMGFTIVVNIGDQWSDLAGGHAVDCEKLPNKIYLVE
ncbi:MAG: HAD family acid phosphatase [Candidatus Obscuribacterales bacterium]|nr:HAD family acid phosphatase [Candidatus Obscuribacterales bacterium]